MIIFCSNTKLFGAYVAQTLNTEQLNIQLYEKEINWHKTQQSAVQGQN